MALKKWQRTLFFELPIFAVLIYGIMWWQSRNLVETGASLPDFALVNLNEKMVYSSEIEGKRTLLYFYAPWCGICNQTAPTLVESFKDRSDINFYMVGLSFENVDELRSFGKKHGVPNENMLIGNAAIQQLFAVEQFPTMYIINENARIETSGVGLAKAYLIKYFNL